MHFLQQDMSISDGNNFLVSAIIPTHNRSRLLNRSINSVLNQTYSAVDCIVIDDGSTDNTTEVIDEIKDDRLIFFSHKSNKGASAARNTGIRNSNGEFIAFLDDDDEWLPTKLEKQVEILRNLPSKIGMVYCWMDYFENGKLIYEHHPKLRGSVFLEVLETQRLGGCPTLLVRKEVFDKIGLFDESLPRGNDGDFIRRVCREYEVDLVPEVLVKVHVDHGKKRISENDKVGLLNHIISQKHKLKVFRRELENFPLIRNRILKDIGDSYYRIGKKGLALQYYIRIGVLYILQFTIIKFNNWAEKY